MGRLLSYLFEVTERFGMETRTELILLQRTMVVVEGVARSLNPKMNIWDVAKPIVEDYIKTSIGPRAFAKDLGKTALVLARFGPRLPGLMEQVLIPQVRDTPEPPPNRFKTAALWSLLGAVVGGALVALVEALL